MTPGIQLAQARQLLKTVVPRNRKVLGVSFPDPAHTKSQYLELAGDGIYVVKRSETAAITRSGVIRVGLSYLDVDYGAFSALNSIFSLRWRRTQFPRVVSLWSHNWTSYYHWLVDVAPRIAVAKLHFGAAIDEVTFAYPRTMASYEIETLDLLGVKPSNVVNPNKTGELTSAEIFAMPLPGWRQVSSRIFALRRLLAPHSSPDRRLYISRSGRRKIVNEGALIRLLDRYGFEYIEDCPRSLAEQIALFASASHVVAPHGAALSNILWAGQSTKVLELANSAYSPDYFVKLATLLGQRLSRLIFGTERDHWSNLERDFLVDLDQVQVFIEKEWRL